MTTVSYLMSVITSKKDMEIILAILNTAGVGQSIHGFSDGTITKDLWIIPKARGTKQEVISQLQAIPAIQSVSIAELSNPVNVNELANVRELFTHHGWDARNVSDDTLSLYINASLQSQYIYFIDYDAREKGPVIIQIKPLQEHPDFSPDWLKVPDIIVDESQDREFKIDDFEFRSVRIEKITEVKPPPPPPDKKQ